MKHGDVTLQCYFTNANVVTNMSNILLVHLDIPKDVSKDVKWLS